MFDHSNKYSDLLANCYSSRAAFVTSSSKSLSLLPYQILESTVV